MDWVEKLHTTFFVEVNDGKTGTLAAVKTGEAKLKWVYVAVQTKKMYYLG